MLLSLNILAERLTEYQPELHIKEGNRTISTVRIIADDLNLSASTVYLNQMSSDKILVSNGPDYLVLTCTDINMVLNSVLDAFEYYNDWSNELTQRIKEGCSLETVLEAGASLLEHFLVLADPTFLIYKSYGPAELLDAFPEYKKAIEDKMLPLDVLIRINEAPHIRRPDIPSYEVAVPSMKINTVVTNLFSYSTHNGWLITHHISHNYTQGEKDLQDAFAELLQTWMMFNETSRERTDREEIFRNLLDGKDVDDKDLNRLTLFHWMPGDEKQIYVLSSAAEDRNPFYAMLRTIERFDPSGFTFLYGENLIYITNCMLIDVEEHDTRFQKILESGLCTAGKSPRFTQLSEIMRYYQSAKIASKYAKKEGRRIVESKDIMLPYFSELIRENSAIPAFHPDIETLKKYDEAHNTQLCETLRILLKNRFNYEKTKNDLFIHRSTLLYRISRIQDLTSFDLDNYDDYLLLELSFLLERINQK